MALWACMALVSLEFASRIQGLGQMGTKIGVLLPDTNTSQQLHH